MMRMSSCLPATSVAISATFRRAAPRWRGILWILHTRLALACAVASAPASAQQIDARATDLSPAVMDRWLVVQKEIVARIKKDRAAGKTTQPSETEVQTLVVEACGKAGFATLGECITATGYIGVLVSGYDPDTRRYIDPLFAARRRILQIEFSTKMSEAEKEKALVSRRESLEVLRKVLPGPVPKAHLELMDYYHRRILEANR